MFILDIKYTVDLDKINQVVDAHRAWLDIYYQKGIFLFSGPKNPRIGGIIIASNTTLEDLKTLIKDDPFLLNGYADYTISEFIPAKAHPKLQAFL